MSSYFFIFTINLSLTLTNNNKEMKHYSSSSELAFMHHNPTEGMTQWRGDPVSVYVFSGTVIAYDWIKQTKHLSFGSGVFRKMVSSRVNKTSRNSYTSGDPSDCTVHQGLLCYYSSDISISTV